MFLDLIGKGADHLFRAFYLNFYATRIVQYPASQVKTLSQIEHKGPKTHTLHHTIHMDMCSLEGQGLGLALGLGLSSEIGHPITPGIDAFASLAGDLEELYLGINTQNQFFESLDVEIEIGQ